MIIIFGIRDRQIELSSGQFYCPTCGTTRQYKHKRAARYFTLFFIPLFRIQNLGEFVECQSCYQTFQRDVLDYRPPSPADRMRSAARKELEAGTPIHMVQHKLVADGADPETARQITEAATGGLQVTCPQCGFSYLGTIRLCANCGSSLGPRG